jgi:hypothetical protein
VPMDSARGTSALPLVGFPIRRSRGQRLVSTSPGLIAAAHVLHRLSAPRHPPCALVLLIRKNTCVMSLWSFQGAVGPERGARSFKTQQREPACAGRRGRRDSRRAQSPDVSLTSSVGRHNKRSLCDNRQYGLGAIGLIDPISLERR